MREMQDSRKVKHHGDVDGPSLPGAQRLNMTGVERVYTLPLFWQKSLGACVTTQGESADPDELGNGSGR